ncbi:MAG: DALR domain-containing protein, partial [Nitrospirota bacterium]
CNTPKALAAFHELRGEVNKLLAKGLSYKTKEKATEIIRKFGYPLGLFQIVPDIWFGKIKEIESSDDLSINIEEKIQLRNEARAKKDFSTADKIRQELDKLKIILEDRPDGTTRWKR